MKINSLRIEGLYEKYSYYINFNSDVTLIYGSNGCGKTTVLDILTNIITGEVYKLFNYDFSIIRLEYYKNYEDYEEIVIKKSGKESITMKFEERIIEIEFLEKRITQKEEYFEIYPVLDKINRIFNYVYLPLDRVKSINNPYVRYKYKYDYEERLYKNKKYANESSIEYVEELVRVNCYKINSNISYINDAFRNNLLKSLLDIDVESRVKNIKEGKEILLNITDIRQTKNEYIKILRDINQVNDDLEYKYNKFFDDFIEEVSKNEDISDVSKLLKFNEVIKIKNIVNMAKKMESRKMKVRKPLEVFLNTVNEFISINNEDNKEIKIDKDGRIYFTVRGDRQNQISIKYLSSGEKQLVTFFANLVFGVNTKNGIFVVDEPELSLHLAWQRIFVEKTMEINNNIQLIFATHSPEIIGRYREKVFKLSKLYFN